MSFGRKLWRKRRNQEEKRRKYVVFLCEIFCGHWRLFVLMLKNWTVGKQILYRPFCNNTKRNIHRAVKTSAPAGNPAAVPPLSGEESRPPAAAFPKNKPSLTDMTEVLGNRGRGGALLCFADDREESLEKFT